MDEAKIPAACEKPTLPLTFENEWYRAEINKDGYVASLIEKKSGCELVARADANGRAVPFGALAMQMDYGDSWWALNAPNLNRDTQAYEVNLPDPLFREDSLTFLPFVQEAVVEEADEDRIVIRQKAVVSYWIAKVEYTTTITLSKSAKEIAYHTEFVNQAKCIRLRAAFPVKELAEIRRQIPYAIVPFGAGEQTTQMFMDARNAQAGLAVINCGTPAGIVEEGVMLLSLFRSTAMEYKCDSDLSYNLGRNFAFDYAVCPHAAGDDETIWRAALAMNTPMIPCQPFAQDALPRVDGAYVSCIRELDDGLFVRLYNPFGEERECCVQLPASYASAVLTDGLGQPLPDAEKLASPKICLTLGKYKVQGILLK